MWPGPISALDRQLPVEEQVLGQALTGSAAPSAIAKRNDLPQFLNVDLFPGAAVRFRHLRQQAGGGQVRILSGGGVQVIPKNRLRPRWEATEIARHKRYS